MPITPALAPGLQAFKSAVIFIDPAVSFGVGESSVNDAEQGLVGAGRRVRNELDCAVIYIRYTGKQRARDKVGDKYAERGGSAFADDSRRVKVQRLMEPKEWQSATGDELAHCETGFRLTTLKLIYAPRQGELFIKRRGHLLAGIKRDVSEGKPPMHNGLFDNKNELGITETEISAGIRMFLAEQRFCHEPTGNKGRGGVREYLRPMDCGGPE
jgi:hypothetical protein